MLTFCFYPNQVAQDLVDIQPLDGQVGQIFTLTPRYTNVVPGLSANDEVFRNYPTNHNYASETVVSEAVGTGDNSVTAFTHTLAQASVRPGTLTVTAGTVSGTDDSSGNITGTGIAVSSKVNYSTGAISVSFSTAPATGTAITANYNYSSEGSENSIRQLEVQLDLTPVKADIHPILVKWSVAAGLAAQAHLAIDTQDVLSELAAQYIKIERDEFLINLIVSNATATAELNFNATRPTGYSRQAFYGEIEVKIDHAASVIQRAMGRGAVDWVLCGTNAAEVFQNCRTFQSEPVAAPIGAHRIGTLRDGTITVVKSLTMGVNDYVFGYKGYTMGDSAIILAEWIPEGTHGAVTVH